MKDHRSVHLRWLLAAFLCAAGGADAMATILLPPNQIPFTMPANQLATADVCRFSHSSSKKKNDFDVTVYWGDGDQETFHPNKTGKQSYVARRAHQYDTCGEFQVTCDIVWKDGLEQELGVPNTAIVSGISPPPVMTISVACAEVGATGLTASVPSGATDYEWSILDADGNDLSSLITSATNTEAITFDAAAAGTLMFVSLNETAADTCPAATATERVMVDFSDVGPTHPQHDDVCTLAANQVSEGCGAGAFCPDNPVTRQEMTMLALKGKHWADVPAFDPGVGTGSVFTDVPESHEFVDWIEAAAGTGEAWTGACDTALNFCPTDPVTRAQMARFLELAKGTLAPPPATGAVYADVGATDFAADFIEQMKADFDLVPAPLGCGTGIYCPSSATTRAHLAHFLVHLFGIPSLTP